MHHVYAWLRATYRSGGTTAKSAAVRLAMSESPPGGLPYRRELRRSVQTGAGARSGADGVPRAEHADAFRGKVAGSLSCLRRSVRAAG